MKLYTMKDVMGILNVTRMTLLSWEEKGKLHPVRTPGGRRRFLQEEIDILSGSAITNTEGKVFIYCRVSTKKQQDSGNLQRQKERLIAIITSFSARLYGARGGRKVKQCLTELAKGGD